MKAKIISDERLGDAMPKYATDFTSNAKYENTLPDSHASKQYLHLPNYILWHTHRCEAVIRVDIVALLTLSGSSYRNHI